MIVQGLMLWYPRPPHDPTTVSESRFERFLLSKVFLIKDV